MMAKLFRGLLVTSICERCGEPFTANLTQMFSQNTPKKFCGRRCRRLAFHDRRAEGLPACDACGGGHILLRGTYGLPLCGPCKTVAYMSCWRKVRYADEQSVPAAHPDGGTFHPYGCPLCPGWHVSAQEAVPPDYRERLVKLSAFFQAVEFDIDAARGWSIRFDQGEVAFPPGPQPLGEDL